ncbi:hypothetical protein ARMGADRAFT_1082057 [Armillaria gallica]|uniref:Uncharacterized protein n=1 Tax=Armillaria gallica TaxID=47427 RepID=A0A2H3D7P0_ARMGA|nr:hypothetical protein ARMGADRAFT_1082057 [Armillaria gallica]
MPSAETLLQASPINDYKHPLPPNTDATDRNLYQHAKWCKAHYEQSLSNRQCPSKCTQNLMKEMVVPIHTSLQTEGLSAAKGAYSVTVRKDADAKVVHSIDELVDNHGFRLVEWGDGPIMDAKNCVVAIIAGQPSDPSYTCPCMEAFDVMAAEENDAQFHKH